MISWDVWVFRFKKKLEKKRKKNKHLSRAYKINLLKFKLEQKKILRSNARGSLHIGQGQFRMFNQRPAPYKSATRLFSCFIFKILCKYLACKTFFRSWYLQSVNLSSKIITFKIRYFSLFVVHSKNRVISLNVFCTYHLNY